MNIFLYKSNNFGDAVSKRFWKEITTKTITNDTNNSHYVTIGSVLHFIKHNSIVFGAGFISETSKLPVRPASIISVRGPLTREKLITSGIQCPPNYGDPLILMPCIYNISTTINDNIVGIIPHYVDKNNTNMLELKKDLEKNRYIVKVIDIEVGDNYGKLINDINSCKYIISSSLHGVIMGIVYKKNTCFLEFSNKVIGGHFKFNDFFKSIDINFTYNKCYNTNILNNTIIVDYDKLVDIGTKLIKLIPVIDDNRKIQLTKKYQEFYK